ncbi:FAD:protein FMN transferase [Maribellus sp. YY47]|uniref:FAD:protein FMN transferase n=1 Tax=Maribellus sp. YY47 TaxID=2929486 RepID=UPI0020009045|nr:FAD:protein FMN transferase [Maribellus sp. YY47]MCK3684334.1 FAD:protein FMN transferase [Maribellus sp. YY47]
MKIRISILVAALFFMAACQQPVAKYIANNGTVYGTYYSIKYESPDGSDLQEKIDEEFHRLTLIFSHYEKASTISKVNRNEAVTLEPEFINCFNKAEEISVITNGAFDITAAPLINAWGFGPEHRQKMTQEVVDSLKALIGYQKIRIVDGKIEKDIPEIQLNMSAIAKGYTCDLIGEFLAKHGCLNYMVDIGGEVVAKGNNDKGRTWTIGIREPSEDPFRNDLNAAIRLPDRALATSGNYLNFYEENGKKYAHTIDPSSGYPVQHSVLSSTVLANDCMTADAFATAFMVLGKDAGIEVASKVPGLEIYFIYADDQGENKVYMSEGFSQYMAK